MNIIFGFGVTEERVREEVKKALHDEGVVALKRWNDKAEEFDKMPRETAPERYTKVFFYDNTIHFHHINRRHPLSPDGWALLQIEEPFGAKTDDQMKEGNVP